MNEQLTLSPVHRHDPAESVLAARKVRATRQLERVLLCLYQSDRPLTDDELGEQCGLLRHSAGTRRGVAVRMGLVERAGTGVTPRGNPCATWRLTEQGLRIAAELARDAA